MRTLKSLVKNASTVWFYCANEELQKQFLKQAETEGFLALNGQKPTELFCQHFYGINDDMTMGYLSNMIWCLTFRTGKDTHVRVDYEKYICGEEDFSCHKTKLKCVRYSEWNKIAYSTIDSNEFNNLCNTFIEGHSFEEYQAYIYRYLMESPWHYSPELAVQRIQEETEYITQCYNEKTSVSDCAIEVGFSCG